jgi:hypothetical protein
LLELVAFFRRYAIDMRQLARFGTSARRAWFRDPKMAWHRRVFGDGEHQG